MQYNFNNILAEFKNGDEFQTPLTFFNKSTLDHTYGTQLFGPYYPSLPVERIKEDANLNTKLYSVIGSPATKDQKDGAADYLRLNAGADYSSWNNNTRGYDQKEVPTLHIIKNEYVDQIYITLLISSLSDTLSQQIVPDVNDKTKNLDPGQKYPGILRIRVEWGVLDPFGVKIDTFKKNRDYIITALVQSPTLIDIGNPDNDDYLSSDYNFISNADNFAGKASVPLSSIDNRFILDKLTRSSFGDNYQSHQRYVEISKRSSETNSVLISKSVTLQKITEIMTSNFSYPFTSLVGLKLDSRSFSGIPERMYDCKLKLVKVPSNYFPIKYDGYDKRYWSSTTLYNAAKLANQTTNLLVYDGDWDGTFKKKPNGDYDLFWTDNPAWILYDLLTSSRYGLGQYLDEENIDIWSLYKIGRWCDAVDSNGYFVGISDEHGGLEPRYSCNIIFDRASKIFDSINIIASLFRGSVFYSNSEVTFSDDRPKTPMALFTNSNILGGAFEYHNLRRDEQYNAIEVLYSDRFNNFEAAIEYLEDEEDIRKRGIFKTSMSIMGCTSKAMAKRAGKHILYQTIKENQSVSFVTSFPALLCRPGDLIIIEDELKTLQSNFGRILDINSIKGSFRLNSTFVSGDYNNKITVYTPTGRINSKDLNALVDSNINVQESLIQTSSPNQITTFTITGINQLDYGCEVLIDRNDTNYNLLPKTVIGSAYRFQSAKLDDQIYKVVSIVEEEQDKYTIIGTLYHTGKYQLIEGIVNSNPAPYTNAYLNIKQKIGSSYLNVLPIPQIQYLNTIYNNNQNLIITGFVSGISSTICTGYNYEVTYPNNTKYAYTSTLTGFSFQANNVGEYVIRVNAKGNPAGTNRHFDSNYDQSSILVGYNQSADRASMGSIIVN